MKRTEFLKRGFTSLLGVAALSPLMEACKNGTAVSPAAAETGSTNGNSASNCAVTPSETAGPFPTKVPANFVRKDIREDRAGIMMTMNLTIKNANASCAALAGALVDVWHCDKDGYYSEYGGTGMQATNFQNVDFLRGRQTTDASGLAAYTTIFPGWYSGRAPHIHVHVFSATGKSLLVTQIAFPFDICNTVYTTGQAFGYTKGAQNTTNERDGIFSDGYANELATVSGNNAAGYVLTHTIVVNG